MSNMLRKLPAANLPLPGTRTAKKRGCCCIGKNKEGDTLVSISCPIHIAYLKVGRKIIMFCPTPDPMHGREYLEVQKGWGHPKRYAAQEA